MGSLLSSTRLPRPLQPDRLARPALSHWPMGAVLAVFAATAFMVPTLTSAWVADDFLYARSVETLLDDHRLRIVNLSVATTVVHVLWGSLYAAVFGLTPGVLRVSTVVLFAIGGLATYGLCRELDVRRGLAALGGAAFLLQPLAYVLGFSFMSDVPFTSLLTVSTFLYARGLRRDLPAWALAGSAAAAAAFLIRQQGILIPLGVLTWMAFAHRLRWDRKGLAGVARVAGLPMAACVAYYVWINWFHGVPTAQTNLFREIRSAGWSGLVATSAQMVVVEAAYVGLFVLPVAVLALVGARRLLGSGPVPGRGWVVVGSAWAAVVLVGVLAFAAQDRYMPYAAQFLASWGLGPSDLRGGRPPVWGDGFERGLTAVAAASAVVFGYAVALRFFRRPSSGGSVAGLVLAVGAWQALGAIPPSLHYRIPLPAFVYVISLDRYLLPLLPLALCLGLWAVAEARARELWPAWAVTALFGVFAVAGTRDYLVFQREVDNLATRAVRSGIPETRLDGGAQWTGSRLYDDRRDIPFPRPGRSWWINFFAPSIDPDHMISTRRIRGWDVVERVSYSSWLSTRPRHLVVLRRSPEPASSPQPPR